MPRPKLVRTVRTCLVCGGTTIIAHLGLDICRACTVFYRRARDRKFTCRSGTNNCLISEGVNCRKCRLAEMKRILTEQSTKRAISMSTEETDDEEEEDSDDYEAQPSRSSKKGSQSDSDNRKTRNLLDKVQRSYRAMCDARLSGELAARANPPHPLAIVDGTYEILPATYQTIQYAHRLFLYALLQFGSTAFPDFGRLDSKNRWTIVSNFFARYRMFEASYRADQAFGDDLSKSFAGYTMHWGEDVPDGFFVDCPKDPTFINEAKMAMKKRAKREQQSSDRVLMRNLNLRHEEFIAVLVIMFWSTDGLEVSEEVTRISHAYKDNVMKELHNYYRDELQMTDYAARLGELLMLLQVFEEKSADLRQHFEVMRLLNLMSDDNLHYRLDR